MDELFVMRRANGDLFAEQIQGRLRIPVWSSAEAVARYKALNPELIFFWPVRLDRRLIKQVTVGLESDETPEFFLLSDDAPAAMFDDGNPIAIGELFPETEAASQPTGAPV